MVCSTGIDLQIVQDFASLNREVILTELVKGMKWKIVEKYPEAKYDFNHFAWETDARFTWDEPLYGHYDNTDYWVYRRQAVLMANADVDVVFFDYTNGHNSWHEGLNVQLDAWRDARESGVDAPKISALCSWKENQAN